MEIGQVIRKYRKEKNLTQEEMANRLGVSAPAVNKWENGSSCPDIALLAPIARLLGITLDELLSYRESLTEEEINGFILELDERLRQGTYEEAFLWAKEVIRQYPNCTQLILDLTVILDARRMTQDSTDVPEFEEYIRQCYTRALESGQESERARAAEALFGFYLRREEFEKAESYLPYFPKEGTERKRMQAYIYSVTDRLPDAYKTYEELLFSGYQSLNMVFQGLLTMALKEDDRERARFILEKQQGLAKLFEMGKYHEVSGGLELAIVEKDRDAVVRIVKNMLDGLEDVVGFRDSRLYAHMSFSEPRKEFMEDLRQNLLNGFQDKETFGFMLDDPRWQELVNGR